VLNVVSNDKPKRLTGLSQKASGQVQGLEIPLAQMTHHRRRAATFPTRGTSVQRGKPVVLLTAAKAVGTATAQEKPMGQRVKDEGASEGWPVMGWIGVAPPCRRALATGDVAQQAEGWLHHPTRKRADFPRVLTDVNGQPTDVGSKADLSARSQRPLLVQLPPSEVLSVVGSASVTSRLAPRPRRPTACHLLVGALFNA
jgi:hypothetical protein